MFFLEDYQNPKTTRAQQDTALAEVFCPRAAYAMAMLKTVESDRAT